LKNYIKELKIAVINSDFVKLEELSSVMFESADKDELQEASAMVLEALKLLDTEKTKALEGMRNTQKMKQYALENQTKDSL
jgi:hypothetical protein